jgi:biopolymer transport protein ExbD
MRRFSQRNSLVTLNDINVTPLLDLAFVLLIIFIIISPSITQPQEQGVNVNLPSGGAPDQKLDPKDIRRIDIDARGEYFMGGRQLTFEQLAAELSRSFQENAKLTVSLRADRESSYRHTFVILDFCQSTGIAVSLRGQEKR